MVDYVKPNVYQSWTGFKVEFWDWIERNIGNAEGSFELNQSKLAEKFGVSRKTVQNALKTYRKVNLLEGVESRTGRSRHPLYSLIWTFREENEKSATPSRVSSTTPREKNITKAQNISKTFTKGTKVYRYYAMKFRQSVENSTLADYSQRIVSSIIDYLKGKPVEIAKTWLIYLRNWLDEKHKYLGEFFKFFYDTLKNLAREKLDTIRQQEKIKEEMKRKAEIRKEYQDSEKPMRKDFKSWEAYGEALERWANSQSEVKTV